MRACIVVGTTVAHLFSVFWLVVALFGDGLVASSPGRQQRQGCIHGKPRFAGTYSASRTGYFRYDIRGCIHFSNFEVFGFGDG